MTNIVRFRRGEDKPAIGIHQAGLLMPLPGVQELATLWAMSRDELRYWLAEPDLAAALPLDEVQLLAPVDGRTEVWACGVTYMASREARIEESEADADLYVRVYGAERPELFFKSVAWRASGPLRPVGIRADSAVNVPEPELALVVNRHGETVGYTICNDMSSRSIEGENPLYLPQAKIYAGACGLGPWITPAWEIPDPYRLGITLTIDRDGSCCWEGQTSTSQLNRRFDDLVAYLMRGDVHPDGVVLATGTCLVPPPPFTLAAGDVVTIVIEGVGTLTNPAVRGHIPEDPT
jgi:2-dehydro-3-deoxy-D-arabinonate dehydratase